MSIETDIHRHHELILTNHADSIRSEQNRLEQILDVLWSVSTSQMQPTDPGFVDVHKAIAKLQDELLKVDGEIERLRRNFATFSTALV